MNDLKSVLEGLNEIKSCNVDKGCAGFALALGVDCDDYQTDENGGCCCKCRRAQARAIIAAIDEAGEKGEEDAIRGILPECVQMPRFDTGELVQFGDAFEHGTVHAIHVQPAFYALVNEKGEVFNARYSVPVKHPEPEDTLERVGGDLEALLTKRRGIFGVGEEKDLRALIKRAYDVGKAEAAQNE